MNEWCLQWPKVYKFDWSQQSSQNSRQNVAQNTKILNFTELEDYNSTIMNDFSMTTY